MQIKTYRVVLPTWTQSSTNIGSVMSLASTWTIASMYSNDIKSYVPFLTVSEDYYVNSTWIMHSSLHDDS